MLKNKTTPKSTLELNKVLTVKSDKEYNMPIVLLSSLTVLVSMFCMVKIITISFGIFGNVPAGLYSIVFSDDEQFEFFVKMFLGCGAICLVNGLPKHSVKSTFALLIGYVMYFVYHYKYVSNGFVHFLNKTLYTVQSEQGLSTDTYYLTYFGRIDTKKELELFLLTVIFGTCFLLAYAAVKHCNPIVFTAGAVIYVAMPLILNVFRGEPYFVVLSVCCIAEFVIRVQGYSISSPSVPIFGIFDSAAVKGKKAAYSAFQQACAAILCLAVTLGIVNTVYDFSDYERSKTVDEFGKNIIDSVQTFGNGGFASFSATNSGLTNGNISRIGNMQYTGETVFRIKNSQAWITSPIYLRGFTAANYDGKKWTELTGKQYEKYNEMWRSFSETNFYPQFMYGYFDGLITPERRINTITIQNENINKKLFLTSPQLYVDKTQALDNAVTEYDNAFRVTAFSGLDSYEQTALSADIQLDSFYLESVNHPDGGAVTTPEDIDSIYDVLHDGKFMYSYPLSSLYFDNEGEMEELYEKEYQYRRFVAENYLEYPDNVDNYIPENFDNTIAEIFDSAKRTTLYGLYSEDENSYIYYTEDYYGSESGNWELTEEYINPELVQLYYNRVCETVKEYLAENAVYTLSPGTTPYGEDFVEYFINQNHKGYCVHFATAATLLLRRAGIPARYAEGYFVGSEDANNRGSDGFADIPDSNAHSWTEVYMPLVGWQVVDFTPSYGDTGEVPEENRSYLDTESDTDTEAETETEDGTDSESDTQSQTDTSSDRESDTLYDSETDSDLSSKTVSDSHTNKKENMIIGVIKKALTSIFTVLIIILGVVLFLLIIRFLVLTVRNRKFNSPDRRAAALALYSFALSILSLMNIKPMEKEGETEFSRRVSEELDNIDHLDFEGFTLTALNARFGKAQPDSEDIEKMKNFVDALSDTLYTSAGRCRKLIIKYIYFLH